jgi:uncharacterized protein YqgC (DUF456 family)
MSTVGLVIFLVVLAAGLLIIPFGAPGTILIAVGAVVYGFATQWDPISVPIAIGLVMAAIVSEVVDNLLSLAGAKKYGSSKAGLWGAFLGGILGATVGVPVLLIGSVLGAFLGVFLGAFVAELIVQKNVSNALRAGYGAFLGKTGATLFKGFVGIVMVVVILFRLF